MRIASASFAVTTALVLTLVSGIAAASSAGAAIRIVASTTDLASIAAAVGGDRVEVAAINRPGTDPHRVEVLPSYMVRVSRARIYLKVGMYLDQWADQIIDGSHNGNLLVVDCSRGIEPLERPTDRVNASMGDVHPAGNPHYWLDPRNGAIVANTVAEALARVDPEHAEAYAAAAAGFAARCRAAQERGRAAAETMPVREILTYHQSWTYFAAALGLSVTGTVEPIPGIPPTARHLAELVALVRGHRIPLLLVEPYFSDDAGEFLRRETGIRVEKISPSAEGIDPDSYLAHFDRIVSLLPGAAAPPK